MFPEMYSNGYASFADALSEREWRAGAVDANGPFVDQFRQAARVHDVHVVATLLEAAKPDPFNAALLIDRKGDTVFSHRKVHTCFFDVPERACGRGDTFSVAKIATSEGDVCVGLMICMDREYPDAARAMSRAGAEIILVPNCCNLSADVEVGDVRIAQMRGRAFESIVGIAVANYPAPRCDGHSFAVDSIGRITAIGDASPGIVIADFDLERIRRRRQEDWFRWRDSEPVRCNGHSGDGGR